MHNDKQISENIKPPFPVACKHWKRSSCFSYYFAFKFLYSITYFPCIPAVVDLLVNVVNANVLTYKKTHVIVSFYMWICK